MYADQHLPFYKVRFRLGSIIFQSFEVIPMSFIPCTQNCKYQDEGLCTLAQAPSMVSQAAPNDACLNFTPRLSNQHSDGLTNVADSNQI